MLITDQIMSGSAIENRVRLALPRNPMVSRALPYPMGWKIFIVSRLGFRAEFDAPDRTSAINLAMKEIAPGKSASILGPKAEWLSHEAILKLAQQQITAATKGAGTAL